MNHINILHSKEWTRKTIYLDFSSIFGDFFLKKKSRVIEKDSKKTDEKGRVRAGV